MAKRNDSKPTITSSTTSSDSDSQFHRVRKAQHVRFYRRLRKLARTIQSRSEYNLLSARQAPNETTRIRYTSDNAKGRTLTEITGFDVLYVTVKFFAEE